MAMSELKQRLYKYELAKIGYRDAVYNEANGTISVQPDNERMPQIDNTGDIFFDKEYRNLVFDKINLLVSRINEIVSAWEKSQPMPFDNLSHFNILVEYNNVVLAARDDAEYKRGLHYAVWQYDSDGMGVSNGYYTEKYAEAKESFALRSGLVQKEKIITREKAADIKAAFTFYLENPNDYDLEKRLIEICDDLSQVFPSKTQPTERKPTFQEKFNNAKQKAKQTTSAETENSNKEKKKNVRE